MAHRSQGSDMGLFAGLLGWDADDERLPDSTRALADADEVLPHETADGLLIQVKAASFVPDDTLTQLRLQRVRRLGQLLPVPSRKDVHPAFTGSAELLRHDGDRATPLRQLAVAYEVAHGGFPEDEAVAKMTDSVRILRGSIERGIEGTSYEERVLGHQSGRFLETMEAGRLLDGGALNHFVLYVTALMEVKSAIGEIALSNPTSMAVTVAARPTEDHAAGLGELRLHFELDLATLTLAEGVPASLWTFPETFAAREFNALTDGTSDVASVERVDHVTWRIQGTFAGLLSFQPLLGAIAHDPDDTITVSGRFDLRQIVGAQPLAEVLPGE